MTYKYGTRKDEKAPTKDASEFGGKRLFGCDQCERGRNMLLRIEELELIVGAYRKNQQSPDPSPTEKESPNQPEDKEYE